MERNSARRPRGFFAFASGAPPRRDTGYPRFVDELLLALGVAAGLDVAFRLRWPTGRLPTALLEVSSPDGERWVRVDVARAYLGASWRPFADDRPPSAPLLARVGAADALGGLPPADRDRETSWSEVVRRGLRALPRGLTVGWEIVPGPRPPARRPAPPAVEPRVLPPGTRVAPPTDGERALRDAIDARQREARWIVNARLELDDESARPLLRRAVPLLEHASAAPPAGGIRWIRPLPWHWNAPPRFVLSSLEVAALFPSPWSIGGGTAGAAPPGTTLWLGRSESGHLAGVRIPEFEGRHVAILGQTGMGKSTALVRLALQAIRLGTVLVLDPIGDTGRTFLDHLPSEQRERARWINASRPDVSFNALAAMVASPPGSPLREKARGDLISALRRVRSFRFGDTPFWGPRLEEMLGRAFAAAGAYPAGTMVEAHRLLAGVGGRTLSGVPPAARALVEGLETLARSRPEEVDGARRLLSEISENETLRRLLCDPSPTYLPAELVGPSAAVVVTGEAPFLGESAARYFLGVVLSLAWSELVARPGGGKTFLILDEAQWYAHDAAAEVLRLGRRSNVHLWLATQSLAALAPDVKESVLTNAADILLFRGSPEDAREFARWTNARGIEEFLSLGRGQAIVLSSSGGVPERVDTLPLPPRRHSTSEPGRVPRQVLDDRAPPVVTAPLEPTTTMPTFLDVLRAAELHSSPGPTFDFPFVRVRELLGTPLNEVRTLGAELRRAEVLAARRAGTSGDRWVIDRLRYRTWGAGGGSNPVPAAAVGCWREAVGADSSAG